MSPNDSMTIEGHFWLVKKLKYFWTKKRKKTRNNSLYIFEINSHIMIEENIVYFQVLASAMEYLHRFFFNFKRAKKYFPKNFQFDLFSEIDLL